MNRFLLVFLISVFHNSLFAQPSYPGIKISDDLSLLKITENAYVHVSISEAPGFGRFSSNGLIFINNGKAFLFDTPTTDSLTKILVDYITRTLKLQIAGFVPNHWHIDCMGGLAYLQSIGIESWANQMTIDIARKNNLPVPEQAFADSLILKIGDKTIECYYPGPGHTSDNIVVWIPSEKILFAGCMVKDMNSTGLGNISEADLNQWPITIEKVITRFREAEVVIPGHGQPGGPELLDYTLKLLIR
jgi:metallo-beta-lactamase class B